MDVPEIELQNIRKYYYSEATATQALRRINLSFRMNEFVAVTGESGSGKSTLLKLISGMETYDEGEILLQGVSASQFDDDAWERYRRQKIGYIFQDYSLIGHYSAGDNIVSALLIMGMDPTEAREKARLYLKRVGLEKQEKQMTSKLSSGQKQRLSIARALAKGTDIILADEPTGNLDSENSEQIIRLLADLARDHLVIMVTHNYEQAAPYVTRKICLHDGEVVSDTPVNQQSESDGEDLESKRAEVSDGSRMNRTAFFFAALNIRTQVGKVALFTAFLLVTAIVSFLFIGELLMNADDRITRTYNPAAFHNEKLNRIAVRRQDKSPITTKDVERLRSIKNVTLVDPYGYINDINYYYQDGKDYLLFYGYSDREYIDSEEKGDSIQFLDDSHFMYSSDCISEGELSAGKMPEQMDEIVLYSAEGEAMLNQKLTIYLRDLNAWGSEEFLCKDFTVAGILKEKSEQIYFSPEYCQMLVSSRNSGRYTMHFYFHFERGKVIGQDDFIPIMDENLGYAPWTDGEAYELRISEGYKVPEGNPYLPSYKELAFSGGGPLVPDHPKKRYYLDIFSYDEDGVLQAEPTRISAWGVNHEEFHKSSAKFLMMSKEAFTSFEDMNNYQASVYFTSYAKTAHVLDALAKAGYEGISTYQVSVADYDEEKVMNRLTIIVIALVVLLLLFLAEILILRSLMKIQIKDFFVMKFMGMKMKLMRRISYYEMMAYLAAALLVSVFSLHLAAGNSALVHEMLYYYELPGYLLFAGYNLMTCLITIALFNHLLKGRMDK